MKDILVNIILGVDEMNKHQAYEAMKKGNIISHNLFSSNEFLYMQLGKMYSEEGYRFEKGWDMRTEDYWQNGWYVIAR